MKAWKFEDVCGFFLATIINKISGSAFIVSVNARTMPQSLVYIRLRLIWQSRETTSKRGSWWQSEHSKGWTIPYNESLIQLTYADQSSF